MGLLLSIFFSYVGAVEFAFIVRDIVHQIELHQQHIEENRSCDGLEQIQQNIRDSLILARSRSQSCTDDVNSAQMQLMQDGVQYENGYRVASTEDLAANKRWMEARNAKVNEDLEHGSPSPSDDDINVASDHSTLSLPSQDNSSTKTVLENESWTFIEMEKRQNQSATGYPQSLNDVDELSDTGERTSQLVSPTSSSINEMPDIYFDEYSDAQMRALDGIKQRPLVRNDGTKRRRAFKKSTSSTSSSEEKRKSREEELKMFTSLEEEEFEAIKNSDYKPLQYSSEPNLKTKRHLRHHNRSPMRRRHDSEGDEYDNDDEYSIRKRNGDADDTINDPWGDVKPEHYHDTDLWKRERAMSIAENDDSANEDDDDTVDSPSKAFQKNLVRRLDDEGRSYSPVGLKKTQSSSFEAATDSDHERVTEMLNNGAQSANAGVSFFLFCFVLRDANAKTKFNSKLIDERERKK